MQHSGNRPINSSRPLIVLAPFDIECYAHRRRVGSRADVCSHSFKVFHARRQACDARPRLQPLE
jgi:hypothetical protein